MNFLGKRRIYQVGLLLISYFGLTPINVYAERVHGYSIYGDLKYPADFKHYDHVNPEAPKGGTLIMADIGTFDSLNPFVIKGIPAAGLLPLGSSYMHASLGDKAADELFTQYGYVAESFELAPDRSWLICHINPQARFHDDSPIQAEDVIYSFQMLTTQGNPYYKTYYKDVQSVQQINNLTVKFVFANNQNPELALILAQLPVLSKRYWTETGFDKADLKIPVGSGPYKIVKVEPGHSVTYERVKNWWGENLPVNKGRYNIDRIHYDYFRDDAILFEAFKSGAIDFRFENVAKNWATAYDFPLFKQGKIVKQEFTFDNPEPMYGFIFNTRRQIFKNIAIRRAITLCYDFEWLNKNFFHGFYKRTRSYFGGSDLAATGKPTANEQAIMQALKSNNIAVNQHILDNAFKLPMTDGSGHNRHQLAKAMRILKQAGYQIIKGQLIDPDTKEPVRFKILINYPGFERVTQNFITNLGKVGIQAALQTIDKAQYTSRINNDDYDMIYSGYAQSLIPGNEQREYWGSASADVKGSRNYAGIKNPAIDAVIEQIIQAADYSTLTNLVKVLDRLLLWGYYMVPSYNSQVTPIACKTKLKHPKSLPRYSIDLNAWWIDEHHPKHHGH